MRKTRGANNFKEILDKLGYTSANLAFGLHKFSSDILNPNSVILKF